MIILYLLISLYNGLSFLSIINKAHFKKSFENSISIYSTITRRNCNDEANGFDVFYDDADEEEQLEVGFCAQAGLESIVISAGNRRVFLSSEYQAVFRLFPRILELHSNCSTSDSSDGAAYSVSTLWPLRKRTDSFKFIDLVPSSEEEDRRIVLETNAALKYLKKSISHVEKEIIVNDAMTKFRKTILGVEKYRINNPGRLANQYCGLLRSCLDTYENDDLRSEWWGAAANALQYAGLSFRDHVNHTTTEDSDIKATIYLDSLWLQALSRLLDLGAEQGSSNSETWDQKFFSQIQCSGIDEENIQDMMLGLMRVALCAVFSSFEISATASQDLKVRLAYRKNSVTSSSSSDQQLLMRFQPKEFSVMLILSAFYRLVPASSPTPGSESAATTGDEEEDSDIFSMIAQSKYLDEEEDEASEYEYFIVSPKAAAT